MKNGGYQVLHFCRLHNFAPLVPTDSYETTVILHSHLFKVSAITGILHCIYSRRHDQPKFVRFWPLASGFGLFVRAYDWPNHVLQCQAVCRFDSPAVVGDNGDVNITVKATRQIHVESKILSGSGKLTQVVWSQNLEYSNFQTYTDNTLVQASSPTAAILMWC
jgi:hypothetical protein